jgi:mycothiol synthase
MRLRAPRPEDAPGVLAVLDARDAVDHGGLEYTLADLRDEWNATEFDLSSDAVVVEEPGGRIVGYAAVERPGSIALVAPDHEGRGVGERLLRWTEERQRELGRDCYRQWVAAANVRARDLLEAAGYRPTRGYARMVRRLDDVLPGAPALPRGYAIRSVNVEHDAARLHALDALSFAANPDYVPESPGAFREEHLEAHDFDADLSSVAEREGRMAGFLLARRRPDDGIGYVDILAVHPEHRRLGLGSVLLMNAFAQFAAAGLEQAQLSVASDNAGALRVYERAGMKARFGAYTYERAIAAPATGSRGSRSR